MQQLGDDGLELLDRADVGGARGAGDQRVARWASDPHRDAGCERVDEAYARVVDEIRQVPGVLGVWPVSMEMDGPDPDRNQARGING